MSEKVTSGFKTVGINTPSESTSSKTLDLSWNQGKLDADALQQQINAMAMDAAELALQEAEAAEAAAIAAIGAAASVPLSLFLNLPLPFGPENGFPEPPEIALPVIEGSATVPEGDEETQEGFNKLQEMTQAQAAMGEAVFATLDPILQGIDDPILFTAADVAILAGGITDDPPTQCPIPVADVVPSVARMQLFDEMVYAMRRATMAGGTEDPEAPGKILCAYTALAIEKFVRRAIIRVSLPDDKVISLTTDLQAFGAGCAKVSSTSSAQCAPVVPPLGASPGSYTLDPADLFLGFNIVPQLTFYGGIDTLKDYGYNFDNSSGDYRSDDGEIPMVNLQALLMSMKNGINFI